MARAASEVGLMRVLFGCGSGCRINGVVMVCVCVDGEIDRRLLNLVLVYLWVVVCVCRFVI